MSHSIANSINCLIYTQPSILLPLQVIDSMVLAAGFEACDFHRVNLPAFGFSTTYNTAGTAKVRGSRAR